MRDEIKMQDIPACMRDSVQTLRGILASNEDGWAALCNIMRTLAARAQGVPEGWCEFLNDLVSGRGSFVSWYALADRASALLSAAPAPDPVPVAKAKGEAVAWAQDDYYSNHPLPKLHDDPAINAEMLIQALTAHLDTARTALAAAAAMQVVQPKLQEVKANAAWVIRETDPRRLLPRSAAYNSPCTQHAPTGAQVVTDETVERVAIALSDVEVMRGWWQLMTDEGKERYRKRARKLISALSTNEEQSHD